MGLGILPPPGVAPPKAPLVQDFTTSGTWVKPEGAKWVLYEGISGGGCGPGSWGAGGGGYIAMRFNASVLGATESVTIGAGAPASGSKQNGGTTSFAGVSVTGGGGCTTSNPGWGGGFDPTPTVAAPGSKINGIFVGGSGMGGSSQFGAGGAGSPVGTGGTAAAARGALQAGDGSDGASKAATAPGGAGWASFPGQPGAARITTDF